MRSSQQNIIFAQALFNLGIKNAKADDKKVQEEMKNIVFACGQLPNFIGEENDDPIAEHFEPDDLLERKTSVIARKAARNVLRHLLRGTLVKSGKEGEAYKQGLAMIEHCLDKKKSSEYLIALRHELQILFYNATDWIIKRGEKRNRDNENQFEIFLHGLIAIYPFLDPNIGEKVILPQKVDDRWMAVEYQFERMDLSPKKGLLAHLIEEEDRIYAYGLTPTSGQSADIQSHLLIMGTTYPTGQGAKLAVLENFRPFHSVGEGHDTTELDRWIQQQKTKIKVNGQSKGAVMAMITAARHPKKISEAHCVNPTGLNAATLRRLQGRWNQLREEKKPRIHVYAQAGDPVFPMENGLLSGTTLLRIYPNHKEISTLKSYIPAFVQRATEAHIHNYCGRSSALILRENIDSHNHSRWREFRGDVKEGVNCVLFPLLYLDFCAALITRKLKRQLGWAAFLVKPFSVLGNLISAVLKVAFVLPTIIIAGLISGVKTGFRSVFDIRSDYQKPVSVQRNVIGTMPAKALAERGVKVELSREVTPSSPRVSAPVVVAENYRELLLDSASRMKMKI